ncbi:MAG: AraC family transcriptional regulator [Lachnospiraceae bacterium]|nr:AraC family transcriptional regulator [Lachnospiraceae bacterium]
MQKEIIYKEYLQREEEFTRSEYQPELEFYSLIQSGNEKKVREAIVGDFSDKATGWGTLSKNRLQNLKYHFVITAAMLARFCIEGGMEVGTSYNLSDYYIGKCDEVTSAKEISKLHVEMSIAYTKKMKELRKKTIASIHVAKIVDYIDEHLHQKIKVEDLANLEKISVSHLSREFKKEMGITILAYIRDRKLETARNMLLYSEYTPGEISAIFAFADQSYFTEQFREKYKMSPLKYRNKYFRALREK